MRKLPPTLLCATALAATLLALPAGAEDDRYTVTLTPSSRIVGGGERVALQAQLYRKGEKTYSHYSWDWEADQGHFEGGLETALPRNVWIAPHQPGTYQVRVTTRRAKRENNYGIASFTVRPQHVGLDVQPRQAKLSPGQTLRFDVRMHGGVQWSHLEWVKLAGGTIENWQVFRAGQTPGTYALALRHRLTGEQVEVTVTIAPPGHDLRIVPPRVTLQPGQTFRFSLRYEGYLSRDQLAWKQIEGGYLTAPDTYVAGQTPGRYLLVLEALDTGEQAQLEITIEQPPLGLRIEPASVQLLPGQRVRLEVHAQGGVPWNDLTWRQVAGGRMVSREVFEAGRVPGSYVLVLHHRRTGEEASVQVTIAPRPHHDLALAPARVELRPGETVRFEVGHSGDLKPQDLQWVRVEGGEIVAGTTYRAGERPGTYRLTLRATDSAEEAHAEVVIVPAGPAITVLPAEVKLRPGEQVRLAITAREPLGRGAARWIQVEGGYMLSRHTFLAGRTPGTYELKLLHRPSGEVATVRVIVEAPDVRLVTVTPRVARVRIGEPLQLEATAWDSANREVVGSFRFEVVGLGAGVDGQGRFVAHGRPDRHVQVRVTEVLSGKTDTVDIYVTR